MVLTEIISKNWLDCALSRTYDKKNTFRVMLFQVFLMDPETTGILDRMVQEKKRLCKSQWKLIYSLFIIKLLKHIYCGDAIRTLRNNSNQVYPFQNLSASKYLPSGFPLDLENLEK